MSTLAGIAIYDPRRLSEADFLAGFVARHELVYFLLSLLRTTNAGEVARHQNIIGQRGMGKTSLLRRLAIGIATDSELAARYIPLTFREEQYNVRSLDRFWRNCGEALAEWAESNDQAQLAHRLDIMVDSPEWTDAQKAAKAFLGEVAALGRRPVLLVDNFDLILNALPEDQQWALRKILQKRGGPVLYCASVTYLEPTADREAPFYEFFGLRYLEPLTAEELIACIRRLSTFRGEAGRIVKSILEREPERLRTLHTLTGGNPRVLALLYQLLERSESETVFADLEGLLDQLTPFYKARVEDYSSDMQRAVIDAVALNWDPIIPSAIAAETGIKETTLPAQLQRLSNDGILEQVTTSAGRTAYQLSERFFNIWYLMRHGTRRTRQRMRWLTAFLRSFYALEELRTIRRASTNATGANVWNELYCEAVDAAIEISADEKLLEIFGKLTNAATAEVDWDKFDSAELPSEEELRTLTESSANQTKAWMVFGAACIAKENIAGMREAAEALLKLEPNQPAAEFLLYLVAHDEGRFKEADDHVQRLLKAAPQNAQFLYLRGRLLAGPLARPAEAEPLLRRAVELKPDDGRSWLCLAMLLFDADAYGEAETAALRAVELMPQDFRAQGLLGFIHVLTNRVNDAEQAFTRAIAIRADTTIYHALGGARFIQGNYEGAVDVLRRALDAHNELAEEAWSLLSASYLHLRNFKAAEDTFQAGIKACSESQLLRREYVDFLVDQKQDYRAAASLLRQLTEAEPETASDWIKLGNVLADFGDEPAEAEPVYRRGIALCEDTRLLKANLAWLLVRLSRLDDASLVLEGVEIAEVGLHLLNAAIALRRGEIEVALEYTEKALAEPLDVEGVSYFDDLLRLLRIVAEATYADRFIQWFEASGNAERHRPVFVGFVAFVRGPKTLLDVNPEVRDPAQKIYRWLARPEARDASLPRATRRGRRRK